jgi:hypothetical protein
MALSDFFLINGREYEWADICLNVGGVEIKGFHNVSYKESMEKEERYGKGRKPHGIQRGNSKYTGSITLTQSEIMALKVAAGTRSLLDVRVDIIIAYVPDDSVKITVDTIIGVEFTDLEKKLAQGEKYMEIELPFMALDIIYG